MIELSSETLHATTVALGGHAVLIEGPSGAGKSDLALRLIDRGAVLVSDDYTVVQRRGRALHASAPPRIAGQIELRGIGIRPVPHASDMPVALIVRADAAPPRMPDGSEQRRIAGIAVPVLLLSLLEPSAPIKVEWMLRSLVEAAP